MVNTDDTAGGMVNLPAERSFMVQFRAGSAIGQGGPWAGRVEHVVSGRAAHFADCAALREFILAVLARAGPGHPESGVGREGDQR